MFPADWLMFKQLQKTCVCKMSCSAYSFLFVRCVTLLTLAKLSLSMYMCSPVDTVKFCSVEFVVEMEVALET